MPDLGSGPRSGGGGRGADLAGRASDVHVFEVPLAVDLLRSLKPLVHSAGDPTIRLRHDEVVRTSRTPAGPATLRVRRVDGHRFEATAWGAGGGWCLDRAPALLGAEDDLTGFDPKRHPTVARAHHQRPDLRMIRTGSVWDLLVPTILAQRVTSREAARSWTRLCWRHGEAAPGPCPRLRLPPSPRVCAALDDATWHQLGVERSRAEAVRSASRHVAHLQAALDLPRAQRLEAVTRVPGIGAWTAGHLLRVTGGDPDAVEVGDFHVKHHIAYALAGEPRADDPRMLELLAPFAGHRGRVVRLLVSRAPRPPSFGPKLRITPVEHL